MGNGNKKSADPPRKKCFNAFLAKNYAHNGRTESIMTFLTYQEKQNAHIFLFLLAHITKDKGDAFCHFGTRSSSERLMYTRTELHHILALMWCEPIKREKHE